MYALLCLGLFIFVWMGFINRIFVNARRENAIKRNTQEYYKKKISKLKNEVYERQRQGTKEAIGGYA